MDIKYYWMTGRTEKGVKATTVEITIATYKIFHPNLLQKHQSMHLQMISHWRPGNFAYFATY